MSPASHIPPKPVRLSFKDRYWHQLLRRPYKLNINDHGGTGPVVIMLHGLASSSANWDDLVPLLTQHYRCITIELIGFGDSPKPQWYEYTMEDHLRCIDAGINSLGLKQPFTLIGHSLGSLLATRYARQHSNRVSRLVLLSPPVYAKLDTITNRSARQRTSLYLRAYRYIRTHKRVTPENIIKLSRILPPMKFLVLNSDTWIPFIRSLEQCIENQTLIRDIRAVRAHVDIFYGIFDEVIVPYNIKQLATIRDVNLYPLKVNHIVGKRYARAIAEVLAPGIKPSASSNT